MREYVTLVTSPTDWIDVVVKALKLVFGDSVPPAILHTVGYLALFGLALVGVWGLLWIISKIKSLWTEQFWPMFYNAEALRNRELRRRFADHVESEMRRINNLEQWSDHRFAELEAEVQAEGRGKWGSILSFATGRARNGLRQESSLTDALRNSRERLMLLEGEPGAGKSVTLRHVTQTMAHRATKSKRLDSIIPIYVNLKELSPSVGRNPDGDRIRSFA